MFQTYTTLMFLNLPRHTKLSPLAPNSSLNLLIILEFIDPKSPQFRHSGMSDQKFNFLFAFFGIDDVVQDLLLRFEGENAIGIEVVESNT